MDKWHRKFIIMQIMVLFSMILIRFLMIDQYVFLMIIGMTVFFFLEFGVLERQRRENEKTVMYEKSCLFALTDLLSVFLFFYEFVQIIREYFFGLSYLENNYPFFLIYITIRKYYIMKNYSYER